MSFHRGGALFAALLLSACYNPTVPEGKLHCGSDGQCPTGFQCVTGVCYSSAVAAKLDMSVPGPYGDGHLGDVDLSGKSGTLTLDTETGEIVFAEEDSVDGGGGGGMTSTVVPAQSMNRQFAQPQAGGPPVAMWSFAHLIIPSTVTIVPRTSDVSVPVLQATVELDMDGTIKWKAYGAPGGAATMPGGVRGSKAMAAQGGAADASGSGGGGGGGSVAGTNGSGPAGGMGGASYGDDAVKTVYFGSGGGGGGGVSSGASGDGGASSAMGGNGGNGGGAFVLLATSLKVGGTIDVSGQNGKDGSVSGGGMAGGGGGGSGGIILLGGTSIVLAPGHSLTALGGMGGAGAGGGGAGGAGAPGRIHIATGQLTGMANAMPASTTEFAAPATFPR